MENYILVLANFYLAHTAAVIDNQNLFNWNAAPYFVPSLSNLVRSAASIKQSWCS